MEKIGMLAEEPLLQTLSLTLQSINEEKQLGITFDTWEDYYNWYYRWTHNWFSCNLMCKSYLLIDSVIFTWHMLLNLVPLNSWA